MEKLNLNFEKLKKSIFQKPTLDDYILAANSHIEHLFSKYSDRDKSTHIETALDTSITVINFQLFKSIIYFLIASVSVFFGIKVIGLILNYAIVHGFKGFIDNGLWKYVALSIIIILLGLIAFKLFVSKVPYSGDKKELKKRFKFLLSHSNIENLKLSEIKNILSIKTSKYHYESFSIPVKINTKIEYHLEKNLKEYIEYIQDIEIFKRCVYLCWEKYSDSRKLNMIMRIGAILFKMEIIKLPDSISSNTQKRELWEILLERTKSGLNDSIFSNFLTSSGGNTRKIHSERYKELIQDFYEIGFVEGINFINNKILNELNNH